MSALNHGHLRALVKLQRGRSTERIVGELDGAKRALNESGNLLNGRSFGGGLRPLLARLADVRTRLARLRCLVTSAGNVLALVGLFL